jgi:hypothetical protein
VPAPEAQVLNVSAGGLGDPQPVQGEQRDQRVHGRRTEPRRYQQRAELIEIQGDGMRLVIDSRPADMGGGRAVQEFLFDGVPVNPAMVDSRRVTVALARPIASSSRAKPAMSAMSARRTANGARDPVRHQLANWAQVQRIGLAGQDAVPGQEPGERDPLGIGERGLDRGEHGGWGSSSHRSPPG